MTDLWLAVHRLECDLRASALQRLQARELFAVAEIFVPKGDQVIARVEADLADRISALLREHRETV